MRPFEPFTWQHFLPVLFFLFTGFGAIRLGRRCNETSRTAIGVVLALMVLLFIAGGSLIKVSLSTWDHREDLPLHLCRLVAWILPFAIWRQSRTLLGIFYFWILAGTLQGLITPDLAEGFPSYFYFRYWFLHAGLVVAILYCIMVFRLTITWKHFWLAVIFAQVYIVLVHFINILIGSNYSYTIQKPPGSILDLFGPWPWYILAGEGVMLVLFLMLMIPWLGRQERK